jgi:hypothetical protein
VITAEVGNQPDWHTNQDRLATLSTHSMHRVIAGSTHQSLIDDPTHAAQSSNAIIDIVHAVRSSAGPHDLLVQGRTPGVHKRNEPSSTVRRAGAWATTSGLS